MAGWHGKLTPEQRRAHKITWWVYLGSGPDQERIPRTSQMRGAWPYDATCSCGWDSRTGGGLRRYVEECVDDHKVDVMLEALPHS
jgi:hypothetical protein